MSDNLRERAKDVCRAWVGCPPPRLEKLIEDALSAAVEAEREACAQVGSLWGADCANAIRARKP